MVAIPVMKTMVTEIVTLLLKGCSKINNFIVKKKKKVVSLISFTLHWLLLLNFIYLYFFFILTSCPYFRNELGGEEERVIGLMRGTRSVNGKLRPHRPALACGLSVLEFPLGQSHWTHGPVCPYGQTPRPIESVDHGALYYRKYFYQQGEDLVIIYIYCFFSRTLSINFSSTLGWSKYWNQFVPSYRNQ